MNSSANSLLWTLNFIASITYYIVNYLSPITNLLIQKQVMRESIEKQKNAWIYRSLIRNLLTVTYNFVLYCNGTKFNGITDNNYTTWNYSKNTVKIVNEAINNIIIIIIIILLKFKFNTFLNLHNQHIASLIEAGCVTYNKIHYKYITLQIHYIIVKCRKKNINISLLKSVK